MRLRSALLFDSSRRTVVRCVLASVAVSLSVSGLAQSNPNTFTLPQATPTPSPSPSDATQGPVDESSGARIAPRLIAPEPVLTEAAPAPASTSARTPAASASSPAISPTTTPGVLPPQPTPTELQTSAAPSEAASEPSTPAVPQPEASEIPVGDQADISGPVLDDPTLGDIPADGPMVGEGEWVDVTPGPSIDLGPASTSPSSTAPVYGPPPNIWGNWIWAGLALLLAALGIIAWRAWLSRRNTPLLIESNVTQGIRQTMSAGSYDSKRTASPPPPPPQPAPPPPAPPAPETARTAAASSASPPAAGAPTPRIALSLSVEGATRSVMMFTLKFRLTIANRSDRAVRDLALSAQLASAQRGQSNAPSLAMGQPIGSVERIGPQQSHTVSGSIQLPMSQVRAIQQGATPVFIPLLHVTLDGPELPAQTTSFVIGTPSEAGGLRLHPITLDAQPGTIHGLRANKVKPFTPGEPA